MDAAGIARLLTIERRLPKMVEAIDLVLGVLMPQILDLGRISTREAEDKILDFLSVEGYRVGAVYGKTPSKAEFTFRKTVQFGLISMKGEGSAPMTRALLRDVPMNPSSSKYKIYAPTEYARAIYGSSVLESSSAVKDTFSPVFFGAEGPTGEIIARKYYLRDDKWREYLLFLAGDRAECWCCGRDMLQFYGDAGWCALDVHHLDALANRPEPSPTSPDRVKLVCCSCHAIHHRTKVDMDALQRRLRNVKSST